MAIYNLGRIDGLSAYEVWLEQGNEGTEEEFLASLKGKDGGTGPAGPNGSDGFSPIAIVEQTDAGAKITITDKNGTTTATVNNGKDGVNGEGGSITETDPVYTADKPNIALKSEIPKLVTLTQAEYDALVSANTVDENTYYFIKEEA